MLWTCPECQTQNTEATRYCQTCGERKGGEQPVKTTKVSSTPKTTKVSSTPPSRPAKKLADLSTQKQPFERQLKPVNFGILEAYSAISMALGFVCYAAGIIFFLYGCFNELGIMETLGATTSPLVAGFSLHIVSELVSLFLHAKEAWYLTAKYTYAQSELTQQLLIKLEMLEKQLDPSSAVEMD